MPTTDYTYGIDIGGTKMELVACDAALRVCHRQRVATPGDDFDAFVAALCALVQQADSVLGMAAARPALGLGVPGIVDYQSATHLSANVPCLTGRRLQPLLRERLQRAVAIGNDCQCFALSEAHGGAADGMPSMLGLILGTGTGAGYVVDGRLVRGRNGAAGEWGHLPLGPDLLQRYGLPVLACPCGRQGCIECYVSGTGVRRLHTHLGGAAGQGAETLAAQHAQGDQTAGRVLDMHLDLLGSALAQIVLACDPHAIVLGGGLSQLQHLYRALPAAVASHLIPGITVPPILPPAFGDAGGARGAALLARQPGNQPNKET